MSAAERFWVLAEAAERGAVDRATVPAIVRRLLGLLRGADATGPLGSLAPSTRPFLDGLVAREGEARALVYSAALLLFEELTGRHAQAAVEAPRRLGALQPEALDALIDRAPEVPRSLRAVLRRAIASDPAHRLTSAAALRRELEWFVGGDAEPAPPAAPPLAIASLAPAAPPPRSDELDLETAMVPRLTPRELLDRSAPHRVATSLADYGGGSTAGIKIRRLPGAVRLALLAIVLAVAGGAVTAAAIYAGRALAR